MSKSIIEQLEAEKKKVRERLKAMKCFQPFSIENESHMYSRSHESHMYSKVTKDIKQLICCKKYCIKYCVI